MVSALLQGDKHSWLKVGGALLLAATLLMVMPVETFAEDSSGTAQSNSESTSKTNAGLGTSVTDKSIVTDLEPIVYTLMTLAGLWAVGCLVVSGMMLSGSGGNPQRRSMGMMGIVMAGMGAFVAYKAYDIVGWFAQMG